ncbi:right-handed parallel beta-helix repeat-containing protein [Actinoplanes sp. CA-252034]|uniref:right-handed parallel beta-helix repeat-containing protein n=1 Tax=Actinoplanes sp. CA-252034 TaxID=3239906 RepID=UPI003D96B8E9
MSVFAPPVRRAVGAGLLSLLTVPVLAAPARSGDDPPPGYPLAYSLAATVSPAPLTAAGCTADPNCLTAPAPVADSKVNHTRLTDLIEAARVRTGLAADGTVRSGGPVPVTVFLPAGEWLLSKGLRLPPYVSLRGAGITATVLRMDPGIPANWQYSSIVRHNDVKSAGSTQLVADLTVNGDCRAGAGAPTPAALPARPGQDCDFRSRAGATTNTGGGVAPGDGWTVRQVRITNVEYFKIWVYDAKDVRIVDNRFDNWGGAESGDEDNIGGGRNENVVIEHNQFDRTIRGNGIDFTNSLRPTIRNNTVFTDRAVADARDVSDYGTFYMEGVPEAAITSNLLYGAHIVLQSNSGYEPVGNNRDITNPRASTVTANRIVDSFDAGITVSYGDYTGQEHVTRAGGGNVIQGNTIVRSAETGVLIIGQADRLKTTPDTVTSNLIENAGASGSHEYNTGAGIFDTSGIAIGIGVGDRVYGNTITDRIDDRHRRPTTWFGIQTGGRNAPTTVRATALTSASGTTNTVTGVIGQAYRGPAVPSAPGDPVVTAGTVTWQESDPQAGLPIAGYRVFRDGRMVADLRTGSPVVPGNLLPTGDAGSYTPVTATTVGRQGETLALTATADGTVAAAGRLVPVTAGREYTSVASYQVSTGRGQRPARTGIEFYDSRKVRLARWATGNSGSIETAGRWITSSYTGVAPPGAAWAKVYVSVDDTTKGDVHLVDRIGLVNGTRTEQYTDPNATAGAAYHVVAYQPNGDLGAIAAGRAGRA